MNPAMMALMQAKKAGQPEAPPPQGMAPGSDEQSMPMGEDKTSGEYFLDRGMFGDLAVKVGDEIKVTGKVTTIGNKIGFMPSAVEPAGTQGSEGEFDGGLHSPLE